MDGQFSFLSGEIEEEIYNKPSIGTKLVFMLNGHEYPCEVDCHCGYDFFGVRFLDRQPSDDDPAYADSGGWTLSLRCYETKWRYMKDGGTE